MRKIHQYIFVPPLGGGMEIKMKLSISGNINSYYVQTLCMIFFPGEKFSDTSPEDPEVASPELSLALEETDGGVVVRAELALEDKFASCEKIYPVRAYNTDCLHITFLPSW